LRRGFHANSSSSTYPPDAGRRAEPSDALRRWSLLCGQVPGQPPAHANLGQRLAGHAPGRDDRSATQGYCFNAGEWSFPDAPLRGVFGRNDVYTGISGWESFEPWLSRIESFPEESLWRLVDQIPPEWYDSAKNELERLLATLMKRRSQVRQLILSFKNSSRNPFPNWQAANAFAEE
jgi:hypothetical protein